MGGHGGIVRAVASAELPNPFTAGDTFAARCGDIDHPASSGWSAVLRLVADAHAYSVDGEADGAAWAFPATAARTSAWGAASYRSIVLFTRAAERVSLTGPDLQVLANPAGLGFDTRGPAAKRLAALQAAYDAYLATGQLMASYTVGTRSVAIHSLTDLLKAIDHAKREASAEAMAARLQAGQSAGNRVLVRM